MADTTGTNRKAKDAVEAAIADSRIRPKRLLDLVKKWRRMQAGSSHQKCKGHSSSQ